MNFTLIAVEEWIKSRKILAPAFTSEMLSKYTEVFNSKSLDLVDSFKQVADTGELIDVFDYVMKNNIDTIVGKNMCMAIISTGQVIILNTIKPTRGFFIDE